jgi:Na+/serine symporter
MNKKKLMKNNYEKLINQISNARKKNNINWMNLLKLAMKFAPNEAKKILKDINKQDQKISKLVSRISKN